MTRVNTMDALEEKLGYTFQDRSLLEQALTHSSCANESRGKLQSNERLEFLGDSILGMVVADHLYRNHPDLPEGELTRTRAALVCEESLVEAAQMLNLSAHLRLGKGEEAGGGRHRPSIQADAVEAMLAAVYLDGDAWILDNLSNAVLSHKRLSHYRPQFSVNEEYRWAHLTPSAPKKTGR